MRLLRTISHGKLEWTKDFISDDEIPPYAILSHTWGEQEVTFDDLRMPDSIKCVDAASKLGYDKIRFCAQQAQRDGLAYIWVDTCCIDKTNNTELSEAINSMFRWYKKAKKCYVYLSDVEKNTLDDNNVSPQRWESDFRKSRWFTRGWTLQELLAPVSVEFFSKDGERLGNKMSLERTIHEITGIPIDALSGNKLSEFSVTERFSWTKNRQTTRPEDGAYCLLGIFDIHLPLIYGEGKEKALKRLRKEIRESSENPLDDTVENTDDLTLSQRERLSSIRGWLSAPDPSTNYHKARKQRQADTGLWLLESEKFTSWKADAVSQLWLYGFPGCGKTILSSTIIEDLLQHCYGDSGMVVVYFYFDFNDIQKQDPELMLRSLLRQLLQHSVMIPKSLDTLFLFCENGRRQPSQHAVLEEIQHMVKEFDQVYIVLDALDECKQRSELISVLETVAGWHLQNLHILMTSRKERDIESSLKNYVKEEDAIPLQSESVDEDIVRYVRQRLSEDKSLAKWEKDAVLVQEIETALMRGACGMFRWAACQLDTLGQCRNRAMLRKSLTTLPSTLDQTYDRILCSISTDDSKYAIRILQWLVFSARPLSIEEIAEVVAIDVAQNPAFDRDEVLEDPLEVLDMCSSLVTITTSTTDDVITLAHYSVQEYLVSDRINQGQAKQYSMQSIKCQDAIARGCLKYLLQFDQPAMLSEEVLNTSVLARYSAKFWSSHVHNTREGLGETIRIAANLLSIDNPAYLVLYQLHNPDRPWEEPDLSKTLEEIPTPLYYAARIGLSKVSKLLLDAGADINSQSGECGYALQAASEGGYEQVVKVLLDAGADVNAQGGRPYNTALQAASNRGNERVVKMLLDAGAEVNTYGGYWGSALQAASIGGHEQIVRMLLDAGAEVNVESDGPYSIPLMAASYAGHEQLVKLLLKSGAKVNVQGGRPYGDVLQAAAGEGHTPVVRMLLDAGADVSAQSGRPYGSALQAASERGHEHIVKLLLDAGAETNAQSEELGSALQAASSNNFEQIVKTLRDAGADVNSQGGHYDTALQAASCNSHEQIVKILLNAGADVNAQGGYYSNALHAASTRGHEKIVKMLLDAGVDVNTQGGQYGTALQAASSNNFEEIVKMVLDAGADVNSQGGFYGNALQAASSNDHEQVVKVLLDAGADVNVQGGYYGNALQAASSCNYVQTVKMLLNAGADVNAQGGLYGNALQAASCNSHEQVVKILLDAGADVNAQGGRYDNALQAALAYDDDKIVKLLLDAGATDTRKKALK